MSEKSKYSNSQGAAYFAVNFLGWGIGPTPWDALANIDLNINRKKVTAGTPAFKKHTEGVSLYYLPDESLFKGTSYYTPIDEKGEPYGIALYVGLSEHNETIIKKSLIKAS